jgi:hypothetical protein
MMKRWLACATMLLLVPACDGDDEERDSPCPPGFVVNDAATCEFDEAAVGDAMARLTEEGFVRANAQPFTQQFGPVKLRNIWVSETIVDIGYGVTDSAVEVYARIDPENPDATVSGTLPMGTMLVHHGDVPPFGVMVKREAGFNQFENDWWFGRFYPDGTQEPIELSGYGQTCMDCHIRDNRKARTDLLWGVPRTSLHASATPR